MKIKIWDKLFNCKWFATKHFKLQTTYSLKSLSNMFCLSFSS